MATRPTRYETLSDADLLKEIGERFFGVVFPGDGEAKATAVVRWQRPLARALGLSQSMIAEIVAGRDMTPRTKLKLLQWVRETAPVEQDQRIARGNLMREVNRRFLK